MTKQMFDQKVTNWVTAVQVATVWTTPDSARKIDSPGLTAPTDIDQWVELLDYHSKLELCNKNLVQTQVLYGESVELINKEGDWAKVIIPSQPSYKDERGYPGWIPIYQLAEVGYSTNNYPIQAMVIKDKAWLKNENGKPTIKLSYLSILPVISIMDKLVKIQTPHGLQYIAREDVELNNISEGCKQGTGRSIVKAVEDFVGLAYFWGGMSSFGYDCSGLAYAAHKANGYQIARDAGDQAKSGKVVAYNHLQPGDLLFFAYEEGKGKLHHVGIYYGDGKMIHSPQTGKGVEIIELKHTVYEKELCAARRYWLTNEVNSDGRKNFGGQPT
ncbi:C40 family peptidase [Virgibacillus salexigens]|uniref:Gamma-D-glutamyl-L-lysine endopeptidase n=1 Tax=Virgibacillus kapii TaxID=1638645 RepID=A0ABQ2DBV4_9BACI|nr:MULTISPECIES: C40 family peptidase [Virgibacillus]MYL40884.1 peptidase [Virgibacillus massiliensis]GGJ52560.1 gamma-D-glutamyl-L-lysine endopeptidase [Virgibacillus kapii]